MGKTIHVVAAIIIDGDKILATQRGDGDFKGGWEFPGGKIEDNENPKEALVREIKEELGVDIDVHDLFETVLYSYPNFNLNMQCFICEITHGIITLHEHLAYQWLTKDTLNHVHWLPADVELIEKIRMRSITSPHAASVPNA